MARHIAPTSFGLMAIYGSIVLAAKNLSALGLKEAIIQNSDIDDQTHSSVFFIVIILSVLTVGILSIATDFFFKFYSAANYWFVFTVFALVILIDNAVIIHSARCLIDLDLKFLNVVRITKIIGGSLTGIGMALSGYELFALVGQQIAQAGIGFLMFYIRRPWWPQFVFDLAKVKKLFDFGVFIYLSSLFQNIYQAFHRSIIGTNYSSHIFAQMNKSRSLNLIIHQNASGYLHKILFPLLSGNKENEDTFRFQYFTSLKLVNILSFYFSGLLFFIGPFLILFLYGEQWRESAAWIKIISINIYVIPMLRILHVGALSKGFSKEIFALKICLKIFAVLSLIASFYVEVEALLKLSLFFGAIICIITIVFNAYFLKLKVKEHIENIRSSVLAFTVSMIIGLLISISFSFAHIILLALCYSLSYLMIIFILERTFILFILKKVMAHFDTKKN